MSNASDQRPERPSGQLPPTHENFITAIEILDSWDECSIEHYSKETAVEYVNLLRTTITAQSAELEALRLDLEWAESRMAPSCVTVRKCEECDKPTSKVKPSLRCKCGEGNKLDMLRDHNNGDFVA